MKNVEKRSRTRTALKNALIDLCEEKSYYDITVQDVCDRAQMYRSSFYRYFETKDEMLREIEHEYLDMTRELTKTFRDYDPAADEAQRAVYLRELTADMEYHMKNERLCRFLLSPAGDMYFYQKMKESLAETAMRYVRKNSRERRGEISYQVNFFAAGFIDTIHTWLQKKDLTPEQIAAFMLNMLK